jgi:hypothetical protein
MAYSPTNWENETPTEPPRYRIVDDVAGEIAASAEIEMVSNVVPGTPITAQAMNKIEQGIKEAHDGVAASAPAMFAAKGDLAVGTGPGAGVRLPVGSDGHVLTANSAKTQGMEWTALPVAVPVGGIIMWSGSVASIPAGWALCNGLNGTPDLRGRFIVGAGGSYNPGNSGGAASVNLSHNHTQGNTGSGGSHSHSQGATGEGGAHTHTQGMTGPESGHIHEVNIQSESWSGTSAFTDGTGIQFVGGDPHTHDVVGATGPGSAHSHTNQDVNSGGAHTHTNPNTASGGSHAHTNPATNSALSTTSILPPYYALCYIMRVA